ncbi:metabolite traffic protein EboE [Hoeflea sp.]|uniref:metabolite traffic protein EboE n=1 Tax=Hoeflea sp. TaxID=1940281 RepID=UPI00199C9439|nr:metabolite traffic protein EboE [Hoeflea sp.]MBC7285060.1 metabolite traffic protein EboE [Hoeflea sp.]
MKLPDTLGHLTYCLNIHATQTYAEVMAALTGPAAEVKASVSPGDAFAIGLRFSGEALEELADPAKRAALKAALDEQNFQAVTVNGFPYGRFHGTRVKEEVYQPDWRSEERVRYTNALADLMAELASEGEMVSLSTVPGTFKPLAVGAEAVIAENILRSVAHLIALEAKTGVTIALAIEPEPACFLETIAETVAFFSAHLFSAAAAARVADLTGLGSEQAASALPRHLGLCYDVCHAAVEYEDPVASIAALRKAGIPVHKLQLSAALLIPSVTAGARAALVPYAEPTYLHQVIRRTPDGLKSEVDLPDALALGESTDGEEWRVHFHVPVFIRNLGAFSSTRDFLASILALHRQDPISPHLEIETYTWDVLPKDLRGATVAENIGRECAWVLGELTR